MPRVAPEAAVHDLAAVRRVGLEAGELEVAHGLEEQPGGEERQAEAVEPAWRRSACPLHLQERHGDEPGQHRLQPEDDDQAQQREPAAVLLAHGGVAVVLAVAPVAPQDVDGEPQAPDRHQRRHQQLPAAVPRPGLPVEPGQQHEGEAPEDVDDAGVSLRQADEPDGGHQGGGGGEPLEGERQEVLHGWLP